MKSKLKKLGRWSALPAIALLAALMLYNGILNPGFFKKATFATFLLSSTPLVCVVIGICTCKIVGGIDISLGNLLSLINVTMAVVYQYRAACSGYPFDRFGYRSGRRAAEWYLHRYPARESLAGDLCHQFGVLGTGFVDTAYTRRLWCTLRYGESCE